MEISQVQLLVVVIGFVSMCFMAIIGYAGYVKGYGAALRDMQKDREELGLSPFVALRQLNAEQVKGIFQPRPPNVVGRKKPQD